ncbi:MAG TPA: DnaJ domain-containing protein, partial [Anaeromyxobacteraceae bacterium]|nr:DnaJ domain-containing protein [Anaeromyxobacteraceae bacterium]
HDQAEPMPTVVETVPAGGVPVTTTSGPMPQVMTGSMASPTIQSTVPPAGAPVVPSAGSPSGTRLAPTAVPPGPPSLYAPASGGLKPVSATAPAAGAWPSAYAQGPAPSTGTGGTSYSDNPIMGMSPPTAGAPPSKTRLVPAAAPAQCAECQSAPAAAPAPAPVGGPPVLPVDRSRRSDPEVARARRQRLLARAMQNMGVGPLASGPPPVAPHAPPPAPGAGAGSSSAGAAASGAARGADAEVRRALEQALPIARETDLFARLGVARGASGEDVKQAYLRLVKQFHPDRFTSPALADLQGGLREVLSALNEAYAVLSDRTRRSEYLARTASGGRAATEAAAAAARADFQKAEAARRTGDHARARIFLEAAVRSDRRPDLLVALAVATLASGRKEDRPKARAHLEEAMRDGTCSPAFVAAGRMEKEDGHPDRAEKLFRAALRADPKSEEAATELRLIEGRRQTRAEARADAKK